MVKPQLYLRKDHCNKSLCLLIGNIVNDNNAYSKYFEKNDYNGNFKPEDHWSCIAHLIAEDMLKPAVIEEKTFKHSSWAGADNSLGPKF